VKSLRPALLLIAALSTAAAPPAADALTIVPTFDSSITGHPQGTTIMNTINAAIGLFNAKILDNVTVNITFATMNGGLGASSTSTQTVSYTSFLSAIRDRASSLDDAVSLSHLPDGPNNPVNGSPNIKLSYPLARCLGFTNPPPPPSPEPSLTVDRSISILHAADEDAATRVRVSNEIRRALEASVNSPQQVQAEDATISLNVSICDLDGGIPPADQYSLTSVVCHEIDEVLGSSSRLTNLNNGDPVPTDAAKPQDLFRYDNLGGRSFSTTASDTAWFSIDGVTRLMRYNQNSLGDFSDWWSPGGQVPHVQDAFNTKGVDPAMSVEWQVLDVLGWSYAPRGVWVDFNYPGLQVGVYEFPYRTIAAAVSNVPVGGLILLKGPRTTTEVGTITKALTITSVGGPATVGQ
jgi:hypothetical protein